MFDAFEAHDAFLGALAPSFEPAGFKRVKGGFRRRTRLAQMDVWLTKSRDTRRDCLICNLAGGVSLLPLNPYFRSKDPRERGTNVASDFLVFHLALAQALGSDSGCWRITSDAELGEAIALGQRFAPGLHRFFEPFESEPGILARLQEHFATRKLPTIAGHLTYPAYLVATGRLAEFDDAFGQVLQLYADDERFATAIGRARRKIERIAGIEMA